MDTAVGLVETYLRINGYFTITEYPVVELLGESEYRTATDVDILAFRFPNARRWVPGTAVGGRTGPDGVFDADEALDCPPGQPDMIIGEVKEGRAELNRGATRADILRAVLARFGCCAPDESDVAERLKRNGRARTRAGHHVRLVAFGTSAERRSGYHTVSIGHVIQFLESYLEDNWAVLRQAQFKDAAMGMLALAHKARHAVGAPPPSVTPGHGDSG